MGDKACKTVLEFCATFLISIRITFFILLISTLLIGGTTVNDGFVASLAVLGSLGMIALDICMMHGILNTKMGLFIICLAFNHIINLMNYSFSCPQNLVLMFSSSWVTMIFGTEFFQSGQELLGFAFILEFIRLNLLTLVYTGMDIMDSPNQLDLPLWTNEKNAERTVAITVTKPNKVDVKKERKEDKATPDGEDIPLPLWTNQKTAERTDRLTVTIPNEVDEKKERKEDKATSATEDIPPPYDHVV